MFPNERVNLQKCPGMGKMFYCLPQFHSRTTRLRLVTSCLGDEMMRERCGVLGSFGLGECGWSGHDAEFGSP